MPFQDPTVFARELPGKQGTVVALLRAGIPLTLLLDLAGADPHSAELYQMERAS